MEGIKETPPVQSRTGRARSARLGILIATVLAGSIVFLKMYDPVGLLILGRTPWTTTINAELQNFREWRPEIYGKGIWRREGAAVAIKTSDRPGGIYFRRVLDPAQRYVVTVRGSGRMGSANLRVRADENSPKYLAAPTGAAAYLVPPAGEIEVLIYADKPFEYLVREVSIAPIAKDASGQSSPGDWTEFTSDEKIGSFADLFSGWQVSLYAHPIVDTLKEGIIITRGADGPSGVFFKRAAKPESTYRLKLRGRKINATPVMRVRVDEGPPIWYPIPDQGQADHLLTRGSGVEVLVYADDPFRFELNDLTMTKCETCPTDEELKRRIISETGLSSSDGLLVKAQKLRSWVADIGVVGPDPAFMAKVTEAIVTNPASEAYSQYFLPKRGGVACGGLAVFLSKVYRLFGLESFWIDIGYEDSPLTHVTTVLVDGSGANRRFYIFDPTFNGSYKDGIDYLDLNRLLKPATKINFVREPMSRTVLVPKVDRRPFLKNSESASAGAVCDKDSVIPYTLECTHFDQNPAYNLIMMRRVMEENGFPVEKDFITGLLQHRLIGIGPVDLDPNVRKSFLRLVTANGVPTRLN